jgi:hypothetical protein
LHCNIAIAIKENFDEKAYVKCGNATIKLQFIGFKSDLLAQYHRTNTIELQKRERGLLFLLR